MKILIAGATGLIGKELVRQCHDVNIDVHYLTTRKDKIETRENYRGFYWNPSEGEIDIAAFQGVDTIVNLAGAPVSKRWNEAYKKQIMDSRVDTATVLCNSLNSTSHTVVQYISSSGISIYPSSYDHLYTEEDTPSVNSFLGEVTKAWERAADQFSSLDISVVKVRTGIVLASKDGALPKLVKPIALGAGAALGSGKQWQSWIHIEDIAGIYLFLIKNRMSGVFNGVAPNPVTNKKMTKVIASQLKKPLWLPKVPSFIMKLLLGEMGALVLESQLVSAKKIEKAGYLFHYVNLEKALEDLL
ncbi:MAG: TIGR01777 family oxidoreductase [Bacteroidota bacterium]